MPNSKSKRKVYQTVRAIALMLVLSSAGWGERLPVKAYTTADGLAQNAVNRIVRDSRGFLWFCTEEGLSRYDGYTFTNYGVEQGLPSGQVRDLLETRAGQYWVATLNGLCRFNPKGRLPSVARGLSPTDQNNHQQTAGSGRQTTDDPMFFPLRSN